jgi:hypothetical protein
MKDILNQARKAAQKLQDLKRIADFDSDECWELFEDLEIEVDEVVTEIETEMGL